MINLDFLSKYRKEILGWIDGDYKIELAYKDKDVKIDISKHNVSTVLCSSPDNALIRIKQVNLIVFENKFLCGRVERFDSQKSALESAMENTVGDDGPSMYQYVAKQV